MCSLEAAGPKYEVAVEGCKVREFARAVLSRDSAYAAPDAVVPPTFLVSAGFLWAPRKSNPVFSLGLDIRRQLHGEIEYVFYGEPPRVGDLLSAQTRVDRTYEKKGKRGGVMRFAVLVTEFRNAHGVLVAEERSTVMELQAKESKGN